MIKNMCGFAGGNKPSWNYKKAIEKIRYRGPDGIKIQQYDDIFMAFCRLAVQDLSEQAMQPMNSPDNRVHIVYNGEIYGYKKLKQDLQNDFHFKTTSDTEVILFAYLKYGLSFVDKIDGIFAIAIYDERVKKIFLIRDRMGVKPLYYFIYDKEFAFASELKAIEELVSDRKLEIDYTAVYDSLFYLCIPEPKTMYKNVYKLRPASILAYDMEARKIKGIDKYWNLKVNGTVARKRNKEEVAETLRYLIKQSVQDQLISDVPVGTFLSGGVDSSIISYEAYRINSGIAAFSIGFNEAQFDESKRARLVCQNLGIPLKQKILCLKDIKAIKSRMKEWYCEPFGDSSAYPTYLVSEFAKEKCTVVLTGDGGDELFGGYDRYRDLAAKGNKLKRSDIYEYLSPAPYAVEDLRIKWGIARDYNPYWHFDEYIEDDLPVVTRLRYLDINTYLPEELMTKVDRVSMAVSLEARVPFLNRNIVEYAFLLSQEEYMSCGELKGCLKDAYKGVLPDEILYGVKMGFSVPTSYLWRENHEINIFAGIVKMQWKELYEMEV